MGQRCAAPDVTALAGQQSDVPWNSSHVVFGQCEITVSKDNLSGVVQRYPCLYGYEYGYAKELSFRTEVCCLLTFV